MDGYSAPSVSRGSISIRAWCFLLIAIGGVSAVGFAIAAQLKRTEPPTAGFKVVAEYTHDPKAFTQGLVVIDNLLYEGTGMQGESTLRKVDLKTGRVMTYIPLDATYFGEGITVLNDRIYQLTWQNRTGFVYDLKTMKYLSTFHYTGDGWGLTTDGKRLILSDGTSMLRFLDPKTFEVVKRLRVKGPGGQVDKLNELEYVKGEIFANIWHSDRIARISPETGEVVGWIDLTSLYPLKARASKEDVLNGIAYDESKNRLFVTGKNWPKLYEIELVPGL